MSRRIWALVATAVAVVAALHFAQVPIVPANVPIQPRPGSAYDGHHRVSGLAGRFGPIEELSGAGRCCGGTRYGT